MSDLDPKQTTEAPGTTPGVGAAPNLPTKMTVWYDEVNDKFTYSSNDGDIFITRGEEADADFPLHFERGAKQDWKFTNWTSKPKDGAPVFTPSNEPVLQKVAVGDALIEVVDRVEYPDELPYRYKYSFTIELADGTPRTADPEIQNNRKISSARADTDH